jgi:hypothetical protein
VKKIKQSYPRRSKMLATPFSPLSEADFRSLVKDGSAIPSQQGSSLFVSKWRSGPGMETGAFLAAVRAQGSTLEVRRYNSDVNVRVVKPERKDKTRR